MNADPEQRSSAKPATFDTAWTRTVFLYARVTKVDTITEVFTMV